MGDDKDQSAAVIAAAVIREESVTPPPTYGSVLRIGIKWWFSSPASVMAAISVIGLFFAYAYYGYFYGAFGISASEAGATQSDILLRLIPIGLVLAVFPLVLWLVFSLVTTIWPAKHSKPPEKRRRPSTLVEGVTVVGRIAAVLLIGTIYVSAFLGVDFLAHKAAKHDAQSLVTSKTNSVSYGFWQRFLGNSEVTAIVNWTGSASAYPFKDKKKRPAIAARIIARSNGTTFLYSLTDCGVFALPSSDITVQSGVEGTSTDPSDYQVPNSCKAKFK